MKITRGFLLNSAGSTLLVLRLAKQNIARLVVGDRFAQSRQHGYTALHGRPFGEFVDASSTYRFLEAVAAELSQRCGRILWRACHVGA